MRDNTDGRNHAIWARNRRSDDYELMCKDGRRLNVDFFDTCHVGEVPGNTIVTTGMFIKYYCCTVFFCIILYVLNFLWLTGMQLQPV